MKQYETPAATKPGQNKRTARTVLLIECVGFSLLVGLTWMDEFLGLPRIFFGGAPQMNWREAALETIVIALVWLVVFGMTRRILRRFHYLEELLTMCAWCRKLEHGGHWVSLEDYCARELGVDVSHGMCPQCGRQLMRKSEEPA